MITTDEYSCYKSAILKSYGIPEDNTVCTPKVGRPTKPKLVAPNDLNYCVLHKTRKNGKVIKVEPYIIYGDTSKLTNSGNSKAINTAFIERFNGTDRNFNSRKVRKGYMFSKD